MIGVTPYDYISALILGGIIAYIVHYDKTLKRLKKEIDKKEKKK